MEGEEEEEMENGRMEGRKRRIRVMELNEGEGVELQEFR